MAIFPDNMSMYNNLNNAHARQIQLGNRDAMNLRNAQNVSQLLPPQGNNMMNSIRPQARQFQQQAPKQGLLGRFNNAMGNLPMSGNLGLLAAGASLLEGGKIGDAVQAGLGTYQGLSEMEERKKRQAAMAKLVESGDFSQEEQALIASSNNPASVALQIRNSKKVEKTVLSQRKELANALGYKPDSLEYRSVLATGSLPANTPPKTMQFDGKLISIDGDKITTLMEGDPDPTWTTLTNAKEIESAKKLIGIGENDDIAGLFSRKGEELKFTPLKSGDGVIVNIGKDGEDNGLPGTDAVKELNKKYTTDLLDWEQNERADSEKLISQLEAVTSVLSDPNFEVSGPVLALIPDFMKAFTEGGRRGINVRENVEEVVQRNLKLILGGQFTEREGEKLVKRAYNPALSEEANLIRVTRLLNAMKVGAAAKEQMAEHFNKFGTLAGFDRSKIPSMSDFNSVLDELDNAKLTNGGENLSPDAMKWMNE